MKLDYDKNNVWHVLPIDDVELHSESGINCHCHPKLEIQNNGGLIVTHNAFDGREYREKDNSKYKKQS